LFAPIVPKAVYSMLPHKRKHVGFAIHGRSNLENRERCCKIAFICYNRNRKGNQEDRCQSRSGQEDSKGIGATQGNQSDVGRKAEAYEWRHIREWNSEHHLPIFKNQWFGFEGIQCFISSERQVNAVDGYSTK